MQTILFILTDLWAVGPRRLVELDNGHSELSNGVGGVGVGVGTSMLLNERGPPLPPVAEVHLCLPRFALPVSSTLSLTTILTLRTRNTSTACNQKTPNVKKKNKLSMEK